MKEFMRPEYSPKLFEEKIRKVKKSEADNLTIRLLFVSLKVAQSVPFILENLPRFEKLAFLLFGPCYCFVW